MAQRPQMPRQGNKASTVAVLVLAGCFAAPVLAASDSGVLCDESHKATLDIATRELTVSRASHELDDRDTAEVAATTIDSVADDHLLKPRVEAAAREVFATESEAEAKADETLEIEADLEESADPILRPMSENKMLPLRRLMYRIDI